MELSREQLERWKVALERVDPQKLEWIARWFDIYDDTTDQMHAAHKTGEKVDREIQRDLRVWKAQLETVTQEMREALA